MHALLQAYTTTTDLFTHMAALKFANAVPYKPP